MTIYQVDAFTGHAFGGNPAAVCLLRQAAPESWMQAVAAEMNLSETAFLHPESAPRDVLPSFRLRWFTPAVEVNLCGHATLASAHVLWEAGVLHPSQPARFHTQSGLLRAQLQPGGAASKASAAPLIEMDFPCWMPAPAGINDSTPRQLAAACGVSPIACALYEGRWLLHVSNAEDVANAAPDFAALRRVAARGLILTAPLDTSGFVSRYFAPWIGIDEDPVTGSAHCILTPYWLQTLSPRNGWLQARQLSRRGGQLQVRRENGPNGERVWLAGQALTVLRGEWLGPQPRQ